MLKTSAYPLQGDFQRILAYGITGLEPQAIPLSLRGSTIHARARALLVLCCVLLSSFITAIIDLFPRHQSVHRCKTLEARHLGGTDSELAMQGRGWLAGSILTSRWTGEVGVSTKMLLTWKLRMQPS